MSLRLIQCEKFIKETCDDYSTLEIFNWKTRKDEVFCMWSLLEDCDDYSEFKENEDNDGRKILE